MAEFANPSLLAPALRRDLTMRSLEALTNRFPDLDLTALVVYDIDNVPASALPSLAEQFGLMGRGWELADGETAQRALLKGAVVLHRHKGTPWAIKQVFVWLGLGEVTIDEGRGGKVRDGSYRRDGYAVRGPRDVGWAEYRIRCNRLLTVGQAATARALLANLAPARSLLFGIDFSSAAPIRNGRIRRDGSYTRGLA